MFDVIIGDVIATHVAWIWVVVLAFKDPMDGLMFDFMIGGVIAMLAAWIGVVVLAFKDSVAWGIFSFLLNPVALIYAVGRGRSRCKGPLIVFGIGLAMYIAGIIYWK